MTKMENISLSREALDRLKRMKKKEESLSDVILRITDNKSQENPSNLKLFEGIFEDSENWEEIEEQIYRIRLIQRN
jgi:predicted CopG family antitoxin